MCSDVSGKKRSYGGGGQCDGAAARGPGRSVTLTGTRRVCSLQGMKVGFHVLRGWDGEPEGLAGTPRESTPEDRFETLFVLSGTLQVCFTDGACREHYRIGAGRCNMCFLTNTCRMVDCRAEDGAEVLRVGFASPELLGGGRLRREMDEAAGMRRPTRVDVPMDPRMDRVVDRMRDSLEHDPACVPLVLSCALELLWHLVRARECVSLSVMERERAAVDTARRILESRLDDPPSLEDLAFRVGMSVSKFKEVFTRACGKPPHAFLREVRLERAMCLLRSGRMRVTEAALEVGYNNLSYFAKAFSKRFGIKPSRVRRLE